jgi:hypothetical protein
MGKSILPSGEELNVTPEEILKYVNPDGLRQMFRQERLRWNLKPNKDADYYDNENLWKYTGELHNEALYQRMEIRTFPDNGAYAGYAGINIDSGQFGLVHNIEKWAHALSDASLGEIVNRVQIGAIAKIPDKIGYGLNDDENEVKETNNRHVQIILDPYDGRGYLLSNDDPHYVNNEHRAPDERLPLRTIARIGDVPTRITDLKNDLDFVSDPDYHHTDNNFTNSNRFVLDNIDDRTFVFPEISKDRRGDYIENDRIGLGGELSYGANDSNQNHDGSRYHSQPDIVDYNEDEYTVIEVKEEVPNSLINFRRHVLTNLLPNIPYLINDIEYTPNDDGEIPIDTSWYGTTIYIVKQASKDPNVFMDKDGDGIPDPYDRGDRYGEALQSFNHNTLRYSGVKHRPGYLPGIFRSVEELERVDLVDQLRTPMTHSATPGAKRPYNYYIFDGVWSPTWFDRYQYKDSYLAQSMNPTNMEILLDDTEPHPYSQLSTSDAEQWNATTLYQWRYNRVSITYHSKDLTISIVESGEEYRVGDILRWSFGDDVFLYKVEVVGPNGQIQQGKYEPTRYRIYEQDPSTHGVGLPFTNMSGVGRNAKLAVFCKATLTNHAAQLKNNLYAYVDIVPSVRSDNTSTWSDVNSPNDQDAMVTVRSTAAHPSFSGINSGRGGPSPNPYSSGVQFHEHGGNATAGVQVHLFRYVINTINPTWVIRNGIQIFTGRWVDQGPMGIERPCDIKALLLSNPDTNNFNNYYKFMLDRLFDSQNRVPDSVTSNNVNASSPAYLHVAQRDPEYDQRFVDYRVNPDTSKIEEVDITDKIIYVNAATGLTFIYNTSYKNDPNFGYGARAPGWIAFAGATSGYQAVRKPGGYEPPIEPPKPPENPKVPLDDLDVGDTIEIKIGGVKNVWIIIHKGNPNPAIYDDSFDNGVILMLKNIYVSKQWYTNVDHHGYENSIPHYYLNNNFYPLIEYEYRKEIIQVKIPYFSDTIDNNIVKNNSNGLIAKVFLLSRDEIIPKGAIPDITTGLSDGVLLDYFLNWPSDKSVAQAFANLEDGYTYWYTRTPKAETTDDLVYEINANGDACRYEATYEDGMRPCIVLPGSIEVIECDPDDYDDTPNEPHDPTDPGDDNRPDPENKDPDPEEDDNPTRPIHRMSGYHGFTTKGDGEIDKNGNVNHLYIAMTFLERPGNVDVIVSTGPDDFACLFGDGRERRVFNPKVLAKTSSSALIQFEIEDTYPSSSPCQLIYTRANAKIDIIDI